MVRFTLDEAANDGFDNKASLPPLLSAREQWSGIKLMIRAIRLSLFCLLCCTLDVPRVGSEPESSVAGGVQLSAIPSPIIFRGDATTAYRDPAVIYDHGWFYLYFSLMQIDPDKKVFARTAWSKSDDLVHWTEPKVFTPQDQHLNYGSPGDVIRFGGEWILCLQTYPRPNGEKFGNKDSRLWIMRSNDLENWGPAELLQVKGPDVPQERMGRMIDPFLVKDKDDPNKWWCFFKQNGIGLSWSRDLKTWTFEGNIQAGENPCVIVDGGEYVLFHSPGNGIGVKRSSDLKTWKNAGSFTLGQMDWPWARGRLTAGFVLDLRGDPKVGKALLFFHGSDFPESDPRGGFDNFASLGLAWSDDLKNWHWPGKTDDAKMHPGASTTQGQPNF